MLSPLIWSVLVAQPDLGPLPTAGSNSHFQQGVQTASQLLQEGKFSEAKAATSRLPKANPTYRIDLTGVPADKASLVRDAIKTTVENLKSNSVITDAAEVDKDEDILFSFTESLPTDPETQVPQGLVVFYSHSPQEPAVEGVIALKRMTSLVWAEPIHIRAEAAFVVGQYLGLARGPGVTGISKRTDSLAAAPFFVSVREKHIVRKNLDVAETLRKAADSQTRLTPAKAVSSIDITELDAGNVAQGDLPTFQFGVYNRGNAPVEFWIDPDCSCFSISSRGVVEPGSSTSVAVLMDTSAFIGPQLKRLYVHTNDPENPLYVIPVRAQIRPAFQFIEEKPVGYVHYLEDNGVVATVYLAIDPERDIPVHSVAVSGIPGSAVFEPWEGELPDPNANEGPKPRKGYKITVLLAPENLKGRGNATLTVTSGNDSFKHLRYNLRIQRGIAVSPTVIYLGTVPNSPTRAFTVLSQPGKPFNITKVESRHQNLKAEAEALPNGEYKITVEYDGKGIAGEISTSVLVHTDSKDSPIVEIPVQGTVQ